MADLIPQNIISAEDLYKKNAPLLTKARLMLQDTIMDATTLCFPAGLAIGGVSMLAAEWNSFNELKGLISQCQHDPAIISNKLSSLPDIIASSFTNTCVPIDVAFTTAAMGLIAYPMVQAALIGLGKAVESALERVNPEFRAQKVDALADLYEIIEKQNKEFEEKHPHAPFEPSSTGLSQVMKVIKNYENEEMYPDVLRNLNSRKNTP